MYRDEFLHQAMCRERMTADELPQAGGQQGHPDLSKVGARVLETDGTVSVLTTVPIALHRPENGTADEHKPDQAR